MKQDTQNLDNTVMLVIKDGLYNLKLAEQQAWQAYLAASKAKRGAARAWKRWQALRNMVEED